MEKLYSKSFFCKEVLKDITYIQDWVTKFGVSKDKLKEAVKAVGTST